VILRKIGEVAGATHSDLLESLVWWQGTKLFLGRAALTGPRHQLAMIAAIKAELHRRPREVTAPDIDEDLGP